MPMWLVIGRSARSNFTGGSTENGKMSGSDMVTLNKAESFTSFSRLNRNSEVYGDVKVVIVSQW